MTLTAEFEVGAELGVREWTDNQQYDVVTCQFALHYFFETERALKMVLHNVALNLKPGENSFFARERKSPNDTVLGACGEIDPLHVSSSLTLCRGLLHGHHPLRETCPAAPRRQGQLLLDDAQAAEEMGGEPLGATATIKSERSDNSRDCCRLFLLPQGDVSSPFGQPYTCAIADTVTEGKGGSDGSRWVDGCRAEEPGPHPAASPPHFAARREYLTFMTPVETILRTHGIVPVIDYRDRDLEACLDPADAKSVLKHFWPRFPASEPSLEAASAMFGAFVFRKLDGSPPPSRLLLAAEADHGGGPARGAAGLGEKHGRTDDSGDDKQSKRRAG